MAELRAEGYTFLRTTGPVADMFVELRSGASPVLRVGTADSRCDFADNPGTATGTFSVALTGADTEISLPTTIDSMVLFSAASGGTQLSDVEPITPYTFGSAEDEATFRLHVQLPQEA